MPEKHLTPEQNAKVKKNLLLFFMFTVCMIFAGLTSAYIVLMGEFFWVSVPMPGAFQISTTLILISSIFLILAVRGIKRGQNGLVNASLGLALILGLLFGWYQYVGWGQLFESGAMVTSPIMNQIGQYGKYYSLTYEGKEITHDNGKYYFKGEELSEEMMAEMKEMCLELETVSAAHGKTYNLKDYGTKFMLHYQGYPVSYVNQKLLVNGQDLMVDDQFRLRYFAESIRAGRSDFFMKGEYGKDFAIYYKGDKLDYKNRTFYRKGKLLTPAQLARLQKQDNNASSFIYVFTGVHLAHWFGGVIALIVMFIKGLRNRYSADNYLGMTLGSNYWHFLGILWLYLYVFLIFIH